MDKKKVIIAVVIISVLLLVWYLMTKKTTPVIDNISQPDSKFPLKRGSQGPEVEKLQKFLFRNIGGDINKVLGPTGVDGKFGSFTEDSVIKVFGKPEVSEELYNSKIK